MYMISFLKRFWVLLVVLASGVLLSGCTTSTEDLLKDIEKNVEVVDDTESTDTETEDEPDVAEDTEVVEEEPVEEEEVVADDSTEEDTTEESTFAPSDSYDGAVSADNVRIVKYTYYWENGQLVYTWTFKSGNVAKLIASYETGYDSEDNLVVRFPSLTNDFVATETKTVTLGSKMPELDMSRDGTESSYKFKIGKENAYTLTILNDTLTLKLDL